MKTSRRQQDHRESSAPRQKANNIATRPLLLQLQRHLGNQAINRILAQPGRPTALIQRFPMSEVGLALGEEFQSKHIGNAAMPPLAEREDQENAVESVYYHRPSDDRRPMNTVIFANPATIWQDLHDTNESQDLSYAKTYTTSNTYDTITVLRVYDEDKAGYKKLVIQHGQAKPVVKLNKQSNVPVFNHLQETSPKKLAESIDLLEES